ncbi:hypothetical protein ACQEU6_12295 [Spirillospora sp. CA-108201]
MLITGLIRAINDPLPPDPARPFDLRGAAPERPMAHAHGNLVHGGRILQIVRHYDAVRTGVIYTAATAGLLASSLAAERLARRRAQRTLIVAGFTVTIPGIVILIALVHASSNPWACTPGLDLIGLGHRPDAHPFGQRGAVELRAGPTG